MHPYPLDPVDRTLLNALQRDGRATVGDLAEAVSLSTSPCWRRVRALEEAGVIAGYHAHLHRQRVGWGVLGFVQLALHDHTAETTSALEREVMAMPQVLSCHNLSGRYDYQLEVVAADLADPTKYTSQWPSNEGYGAGKRPRSATIVITKNDGGILGT